MPSTAKRTKSASSSKKKTAKVAKFKLPNKYPISLNVNGEKVETETYAHTSLLYLLRDLGFTELI